MTLDHLQDLYLEELRDVYDAEKQLMKALPAMAKSASNPRLVKAFESHLKQTEEHVQRLETIFQELGQKAKGKPCAGMQGLIEEGKEMIKEDAVDDVRDAGLITAAQRVEHYEIAAYGTLSAYAKTLNRKNDLRILQRTLKEEKSTDEKLTDLAERVINPSAAGRSGGRARDTQTRSGESMTKEDLYARAQELQIQGRSKMGKKELERAVMQRS